MFLLSCYFPLVCRSRLDLAFLIDGSGSIAKSGKGNFCRSLNFAKRIVTSFKITSSYSRVGAAVFSTSTWLVFDFKRYRTKQQIFRAIDGIRYTRGGTRIGRTCLRICAIQNVSRKQSVKGNHLQRFVSERILKYEFAHDYFQAFPRVKWYELGWCMVRFFFTSSS